MLIVFSHGLDSEPWGKKILALAKISKEFNAKVESVDYQDLREPESRVARLADLSIIKNTNSKELILVGSSMGGYVSATVTEKFPILGLFLMAPAFYIPRNGYRQNIKPQAQHISIVHGFNDEVIPFQNSIKFAQEHNASIYLLQSDHRLTSALPEIEKIFTIFLEKLITKTSEHSKFDS